MKLGPTSPQHLMALCLPFQHWPFPSVPIALCDMGYGTEGGTVLITCHHCGPLTPCAHVGPPHPVTPSAHWNTPTPQSCLLHAWATA
uniref:Uncharacterized protein n=1 Tax=Knipowitschia caucasica TaxID=637954 RepID=A0AAV2LUV2_KNICA